jgi:ribonuclease BN (tRNA processing enzyme)
MKIKTLGCGNAFSTKNFNQQFLLEEGDRKMLVDCGWTTPLALARANIKITDITDVYISHLHADHVGGLEYVAFSRYDWKNRPERSTKDSTYAPYLWGNEVLLQEAWDKSLRGGLESMEGFVADLSTYFRLVPIHPNTKLEWQGWTFSTIQQVHIMTGSNISSTYGLFIEKEGHKKVYITTDSQHCSPKQVEVFYNKADIILQDCECLPFYSGVHANYEQLAGYEKANSTRLSAEIKKKMWLSHYQDFVSLNKDFFGKDCDWNAKAKTDGFQGFIYIGQEFEI